MLDLEEADISGESGPPHVHYRSATLDDARLQHGSKEAAV
jgi:hypothetical protein